MLMIFSPGASTDFNPRSPYGERRFIPFLMQLHMLFQSTLPLRGATLGRKLHAGILDISIHAPLTGSDILAEETEMSLLISIHAPLTGSDPVDLFY